MKQNTAAGHIMAAITILIWGTTFISTKILLEYFAPSEILFFRFLIGLVILIVVYPERLRIKDIKQEITFAAAGLCGVCLYYMLENIALTYTMASNVGVIIGTAPFFTAVLSHIFIKNSEKLNLKFYIGLLIAIAGICLVSLHGAQIELNPIGDILAVAASLVWAVYSLLTKKIGGFGYNTVQTTRRIFIYGIIFMIPALFIFDFHPDVQKFYEPECIFNILYLGVGASALCFVTWNYAVKVLGAVKTSVYIYMVPVITIVASAIVLKEKITLTAVAGAGLTIEGLLLSQGRVDFKRGKKKNECRKS